MRVKFLQLCQWFHVSPRWFLFNLFISFATSVGAGLFREQLEVYILFLLPLLLSPGIQVEYAQSISDGYSVYHQRNFVVATINGPVIFIGFFISEFIREPLWSFFGK